LHFDIAEVYARKIREKFSSLKAQNEARFSVYQKEYNILWTECRDYQKLYDEQTDHGRKLLINGYWIKGIQDELEALIEFQ
jgi:hypothetical protein